MKRIVGLIVAVTGVIFVSAELEDLPEFAAQQLPPEAQNKFLHVAVWQWAGLAIILLTSYIAGLVGRSVFRRVTVLRDRFSHAPMHGRSRSATSRSFGILVAAVLANALVNDLDLPNRFRDHLGLALDCFSVLGGMLLLYAWWDVVCESIAARAQGHDRAERLLVPMMSKFVRAIIVACAIVIVIAIIFGTKTLTAMVAGIGITGLVVALAAKDSVENVFGSLTILFDMPFAIGDWVKVDKIEGSVEEINLRSTRVRTGDDTLILLPNANLIRAPVENFGARRTRRQKLMLRLSYKCSAGSIESYRAALKEFLNSRENVDAARTLIQLDDPQDNSVGLSAMWFLQTLEYAVEVQSRNDFLEEALRLREAHQIEFATSGG